MPKAILPGAGREALSAERDAIPQLSAICRKRWPMSSRRSRLGIFTVLQPASSRDHKVSVRVSNAYRVPRMRDAGPARSRPSGRLSDSHQASTRQPCSTSSVETTTGRADAPFVAELTAPPPSLSTKAPSSRPVMPLLVYIVAPGAHYIRPAPSQAALCALSQSFARHPTKVPPRGNRGFDDLPIKNAGC